MVPIRSDSSRLCVRFGASSIMSGLSVPVLIGTFQNVGSISVLFPSLVSNSSLHGECRATAAYVCTFVRFSVKAGKGSGILETSVGFRS